MLPIITHIIPTAGPESKDISFTTISNRETQEIGTFEKLETVNV